MGRGYSELPQQTNRWTGARNVVHALVSAPQASPLGSIGNEMPLPSEWLSPAASHASVSHGVKRWQTAVGSLGLVLDAVVVRNTADS